MSYNKFSNLMLEKDSNKTTDPIFILAYKEIEKHTSRDFSVSTYSDVAGIIDTNYFPLIQLDLEDLKYLFHKYKFMLEEDKLKDYKSLQIDLKYQNEKIQQEYEKLYEINKELEKY